MGIIGLPCIGHARVGLGNEKDIVDEGGRYVGKKLITDHNALLIDSSVPRFALSLCQRQINHDESVLLLRIMYASRKNETRTTWYLRCSCGVRLFLSTL